MLHVKKQCEDGGDMVVGKRGVKEAIGDYGSGSEKCLTRSTKCRQRSLWGANSLPAGTQGTDRFGNHLRRHRRDRGFGVLLMNPEHHLVE